MTKNLDISQTELSRRNALTFSLRIADITIALMSPDHTLSLALPEPGKRFLANKAQHDIVVKARRMELNEKPGRKVFCSDSVWQLYKKGGSYVFCLTSPAYGPLPYKVAYFNPEFTAGDVFLQPRYFAGNLPHYPLEYPLDQLLIVHHLANGKGTEIHACGVVDHAGNGYLFVGQSGAGKTTLARLWQGQKNIDILSDDRIILRRTDGRLWMYGTPWHGEGHFASPARAPVKRVYFLQHGEKNELVSVGMASAVGRLFACSFVPFYSPEGLHFTLGFLEEVVKAVPCYELNFLPDKRVVEFIQRVED